MRTLLWLVGILVCANYFPHGLRELFGDNASLIFVVLGFVCAVQDIKEIFS
jgi:hypothetical protein